MRRDGRVKMGRLRDRCYERDKWCSRGVDETEREREKENEDKHLRTTRRKNETEALRVRETQPKHETKVYIVKPVTSSVKEREKENLKRRRSEPGETVRETV